MSFRCGCATEPRPGRADRCVQHATWACHLATRLEAGERSLSVTMGPGDCPPCALAKAAAAEPSRP